MVFIVETEDRQSKEKQFFGGWRNTQSGQIYYNVYTQTERVGENKKDGCMQTSLLVDKCIETQCDQAVQVLFFPDVRDKVVKPRKRFSVRDSSSQVEDGVISEDVEDLLALRRSVYAEGGTTKSKNPAEHRTPPSESSFYRSSDFTILNRTSPKTRGDFELLQNLLDRWRILETERVGKMLFEPSRIALCSLILTKEIELLRAIEAMKTGLRLKRRERTYRKFLDELSRPLLWRHSRGKPILVVTPRVQRARDLRDTYETLAKEDLSSTERLNLLRQMREVIEQHTCRYSDNVLRLIDQEIELLTLNVDEEKLKWLRKRTKMNFLRLARDALREDVERNVQFVGCFETGVKRTCRSCSRILPIEKFSCVEPMYWHICNYCLNLKMRKQPRIADQVYERLLRDVRRSEAKVGSCTSLAFAIDLKIIFYLVNDIWQGKSAISESYDLNDLRLVRFCKDVDWSPWNCLLLTRKEASVHRKVEDLERFYGMTLLQKFRGKNSQAKMSFEPIINIDDNYKS